MKKLLVILMLILLTGCETEDVEKVVEPEVIEPEVVTPEEPEVPEVVEPEPEPEPEVPEVPEERIYLDRFVPISDYSDDYTLTSEGLGLYIDQEDLGISYINVEEFIKALEGAVIPLDVEKTDTLRLSYTYEYDEEEAIEQGMESFTYEMIINAAENTIYFNDVDMLDILDEETETDYSQGLEVVFSEISDTDFSKLFDLDDYSMNIELFEGNYYMPLYLANFFLTGFSVDIYELDTEVLLVDYYTYDDAKGFFDELYDRETTPLTQVADDTYNYLALYFDTMYGLKDFMGIDDIYARLDEYNINDGSNRRAFYTAINDFINDLDDLHSTFRYAGQRLMSYNPSDNYYNEESELRKYYDTFGLYSCSYDAPDVQLTIVDDVAFVKVNGYGLDFPEVFKPIMEEASAYDDIVFDLTCNGGGLVSSAISMLTYMTDETVYMYETDPFTGALYTTGYVSEESNYVPANYYVFTSQVTFSAANLFTSAVKDNELGIIIGDRSLGGACAVQKTITPDGAIFNNSSNYAFSNKLGEVIEDGVEPDYLLKSKLSGFTWMQSVVEIIKSEYSN